MSIKVIFMFLCGHFNAAILFCQYPEEKILEYLLYCALSLDSPTKIIETGMFLSVATE